MLKNTEENFWCLPILKFKEETQINDDTIVDKQPNLGAIDGEMSAIFGL